MLPESSTGVRVKMSEREDLRDALSKSCDDGNSKACSPVFSKDEKATLKENYKEVLVQMNERMKGILSGAIKFDPC